MVKYIFFFVIVTLANTGFAEPKIITAPTELGYCVTCHGVELKGNPSVDAPNLSVLSAWYLERQLLNFKQGLRAPPGSPDIIGREMQPMAAHLDEESLQKVIKFIASVPKQSTPPTINGDIEQGKVLYQTCAGCHGQQGEGNPLLNAPRLTGQSDWYLVRQLENFKTGKRGAIPGDTEGAQMRTAVGALKDKEAYHNVVSYINSLNNPTGN